MSRRKGMTENIVYIFLPYGKKSLVVQKVAQTSQAIKIICGLLIPPPVRTPVVRIPFQELYGYAIASG